MYDLMMMILQKDNDIQTYYDRGPTQWEYVTNHTYILDEFGVWIIDNDDFLWAI